MLKKLQRWHWWTMPIIGCSPNEKSRLVTARCPAQLFRSSPITNVIIGHISALPIGDRRCSPDHP